MENVPLALFPLSKVCSLCVDGNGVELDIRALLEEVQCLKEDAAEQGRKPGRLTSKVTSAMRHEVRTEAEQKTAAPEDAAAEVEQPRRINKDFVMICSSQDEILQLMSAGQTVPRVVRVRIKALTASATCSSQAVAKVREDVEQL